MLGNSSSFALPIRLLPSASRRAVGALYQWCRTIDDAADNPALTSEEKTRLLDFHHKELSQLFDATPTHPHTLALQPYAAQHRLRETELRAIIEGAEMDIAGSSFKADADMFDLYCYRVASCVGLSVMRLLGDESEPAMRLATHLGHALQRTNMLRDVLSDAACGRIYMPLPLLDKCGLAHITPREVPAQIAALRSAFAALSEQALMHYEAAGEAATECRLLPVVPLLMRDVYWRLHQRMQQDGWRHAKPYLRSRTDIIWLIGRYASYRLR